MSDVRPASEDQLREARRSLGQMFLVEIAVD